MCRYGLCESLKTVAIIVTVYKIIPIFYFSVEPKWGARGRAMGGHGPPWRRPCYKAPNYVRTCLNRDDSCQ